MTLMLEMTGGGQFRRRELHAITCMHMELQPAALRGAGPLRQSTFAPCSGTGEAHGPQHAVQPHL
jgi:hypothetical protein